MAVVTAGPRNHPGYRRSRTPLLAVPPSRGAPGDSMESSPLRSGGRAGLSSAVGIVGMRQRDTHRCGGPHGPKSMSTPTLDGPTLNVHGGRRGVGRRRRLTCTRWGDRTPGPAPGRRRVQWFVSPSFGKMRPEPKRPARAVHSGIPCGDVWDVGLCFPLSSVVSSYLLKT